MRAIRGITINNEIHTADDLDLLMFRPQIENPQPKRLNEDIPGRDGIVDYSDYADGIIFYENRSVTFRFFFNGTRAEVNEVIEKMSSYHGRNIKVTHDDDKDFYYEGWSTITVEDIGPLGNYVYITLTLEAEPYRRKIRETVLAGTVNYKKTIDILNGPAPARLYVKINKMVDSSGADVNESVRVYTDTTKYDGIAAKTGDYIEITDFLLKGGRQKLTIETGHWSGSAWSIVRAYTAEVEIKYREGKI